ncbi:GrxA family glutaredoxin [Pseudidiomarina mangrovi]|uniref:GrxA family glutaredoxin n=1 Tax=Pseudidiomarina mangrovi TaxID=2487133 RepID=UPI000FCAB995|nr:GrxA family glutaredoxin [Pseudidiomarina mangrovi]CAI8168746.1 MAG: Glutaredoxin 1 [Pseudidiomarina mangrovi]
MRTVIFGRPGCGYCTRAVQIAERLSQQRDDFSFEYIDMYAQGISKTDLEKLTGNPVHTVPQVFIDDQHIGGCTEFEAYSRQHLGL